MGLEDVTLRGIKQLQEGEHYDSISMRLPESSTAETERTGAVSDPRIALEPLCFACPG